MIEKNIRLQPHHARDLLVGRRSDGRRPGYQPPGGGATSLGSGRDVSRTGGGGGRDPMPVYSAPVYTPPPKDVMPIFKPEPKVSPIQSIAMVGDISLAGLDQDEAEREVEFKKDFRFEDIKAQAPKTFAPPIKTYERGVPFLEDELVKTVTPPKYGPTYYQDRSKIGVETYGERAEDMMPRGGILSAIGGGLKKIFGDNPLEWALNIASLGGYEKAKYAKALLNLRKKGSISNTAYKKVKSFLDTPKKDAKKLVKGDIRDKDSIATQIAKGTGLESGAELLGLKGIEGQQAKLTKLALAQYRVLQQKANAEQMGQYKMTPQERKYYEDLKKKMMEEKTYSMPIVTVAKGGRIDSPLTGRSRYI